MPYPPHIAGAVICTKNLRTTIKVPLRHETMAQIKIKMINPRFSNKESLILISPAECRFCLNLAGDAKLQAVDV
ncbi:MAG TPA: hypothetical protein VFI93_02105 [Rhizomicrobium sp.]|nr:hypothetical protein [Rhizomicrobium sp.]